MTHPLLTRLQEKVSQAAHEVSSLRKERERLGAELELMREENRKARRVLREHNELITERKKLKEKLNIIIQKFNKSMV